MENDSRPPWASAARIVGLIVCLFAIAPRLEAQAVRRLPTLMPASEPYPEQVVPYAAVEEQYLPYDDAAALWPDPGVESPSAPDPDRPLDARDGVFQKLIFTETWLAAGGSHGLGMNQAELQTVLALPCPTVDSPLVITPGFAAHFLEGPTVIDVPARVYDAYAEFRWLHRFGPRWAADVAVAPGVYSDFRQGSDEAVRITGHAAGMFTWKPNLKLVGGISYLDRYDINWLPIGGLIWNPHEDLKLELIFPQPKIARRIYWEGAATEKVQDWLFVAGEFGSYVWAVRRADGTDDELTYRDIRVLLGLERVNIGGLDARIEVGYVFGRQLHLRAPTPDLDLSDTVLLRGALLY